MSGSLSFRQKILRFLLHALWHIAARPELFSLGTRVFEVGAVVSFANPTFKAKTGPDNIVKFCFQFALAMHMSNRAQDSTLLRRDGRVGGLPGSNCKMKPSAIAVEDTLWRRRANATKEGFETAHGGCTGLDVQFPRTTLATFGSAPHWLTPSAARRRARITAVQPSVTSKGVQTRDWAAKTLANERADTAGNMALTVAAGCGRRPSRTGKPVSCRQLPVVTLCRPRLLASAIDVFVTFYGTAQDKSLVGLRPDTTSLSRH